MQVEIDGASRLVRGLLFAWIPVLLFLGPAMFEAFKGITSQKATGLGAVAGGLTEGLAVTGLLAILLSEAYAVILLVRAFFAGRLAVRIAAITSILVAIGFVSALFAAVVWLSRVR